MPRRRASATAPSPTPAPTLVRERCDVCLVGNHDLAVLGALDISTFSETAAAAVEWTRENVGEATLEFLARARAGGRARGRRPLPRLPARPDLGVRALDRPGRSRPRRPGRADRPDRPLPRRALLHPAPTAGGAATPSGAQAGDGALLDLDERRLAAQSRQRRPAARRRPARRLAGARHRGAGRPASTASPTTSTRAAEAILAAGLPSRLADRL